jgi:hypothetical protein
MIDDIFGAGDLAPAALAHESREIRQMTLCRPPLPQDSVATVVRKKFDAFDIVAK